MSRSVVIALVFVLFACTGCNIIGPAAYMAGGLPKVQAQYDLPDVPTVVYIDDRVNVIGTNSRSVRLAIADAASSTLMAESVLTETISSRDAMGMALRQDRHKNLMAIDEIARSVGAAQIIYVEMLSFGLAPDGATPAPTSACQIRVLDAVNRTRLFPEPTPEKPSEAWPVVASLHEIDPASMRDTSARLKVHQALAEKLGEQIARTFFKHVPRDIGANLEP